MNSKKFLIGGIAGGIAFFLLGWLVWGMLLMDFMKSHSNSSSGVFRTEADMVWWALVAGNLAMGFLLSYVLSKASINTAAGGISTGAVIGLLMSASIDCMMYAQVNLFDTTSMIADIGASTVVTGIVGGIIGWINGKL
jgi:predicted CDP-diglyceride synthetase/phosphatidate cytidylyltransferase